MCDSELPYNYAEKKREGGLTGGDIKIHDSRQHLYKKKIKRGPGGERSRIISFSPALSSPSLCAETRGVKRITGLLLDTTAASALISCSMLQTHHIIP